MKDVELAKQILESEDLTFIAIKDGQIVYKSKEKGIKPIYNVAKEVKDLANGISIADRVVGKGAAILYAYVGVSEAFTELISEGAKKVLDDNNIVYTYNSSCEYIKNRDKTDYCPVEKIALSTNDPLEFINKVEEFFIQMRNK